MGRIITLVLGLFLMIGPCFGNYPIWICFIGIGLVILGLKWTLIVEPIIQSNKAVATRDYITFYINSGTLKLNKRGNVIKKAVKITDAKNYTFKTKGPELHIGSVTVGNVTTGGAYVTEGYTYLADSQKNGLCNLEYLDYTIHIIQLTDELYDEAKKSNIAKYLNESKQIEVIASSYSDKDIKEAIDSHNESGYLGNNFLNKGKPSREKCNEILNWMLGS